MDSRSPRPPPYSPSPPNAESRSTNDTRNQRQPLLRSNYPSYGQQNVSVTVKSERSTLSWKIALIFFGLLLFGAVIIHSAIDHRTPEERERARWELEREREAHRKEHEQWERDRIERNRELEKARRKERERARKEKQEREERERKETEERKERERKEREERDRRDEQRREEERKRQREEEQRRREAEKAREKSNYRKSGMHWDEPRPLRCVQYGIREYTAHLLDIPSAFDRRKGCEYTPVTINGFTIETPTYCDDRGWWSGVFGHWQLSHQTICTPYWASPFEDVGCTGEGSGKHRLQARLWNLQSGDDWDNMCATTPAVIHGVEFPSPTSCHDWGIIYGMYGIWDIDDPNCLSLIDQTGNESAM